MSTSLDLQLDPALTNWRDRAEPGCAIGIVEAGELVFAAGYGVEDQAARQPITSDTRFDIGSEAKQFTGFCLAVLERERLVALDGEVGRYLPELHEAFRGVTARQLLHHTSGIPEFYDPMAALGMLERDCTLCSVYEFICRLPALDFPPGTRFAYSNSGYAPLALLVERIAGMDFGRFLRERVFDPLGMTDSFVHAQPGLAGSRRAEGYRYDPQSGYRECSFPRYAVPGCGCLYSSVRDLARWLAALYGGGTGDAKLVHQMLKPGRLNDGSETKYGMGLDWGQCFIPPASLRIVTHSGGHAGFRAIMVHLPDYGSQIILLCNNRRIEHARLALELARQLAARQRR